MPYSIMLDAGHGGSDPGAVYNGRREKDDTLRLVLAIGQILQNRGVDVEYTRTTDIYETPFQKAIEANEAGVDYFVSIIRCRKPGLRSFRNQIQDGGKYQCESRNGRLCKSGCESKTKSCCSETDKNAGSSR